MGLLFSRASRPAPTSVDPAAVVEGLRVFAADLEAKDSFALDGMGSRGEMPVTPEEWAAYPTCIVRRARLAYFGQPGPGDIPSAVLDQLMVELADGKAAA